ncbi:MAG: ABC transporter ATP-binding protein [Rhodocyclaceae bacterium]|nr:ABC transporter ATP-binding protein [Rhodocyclaceae bacterium]
MELSMRGLEVDFPTRAGRAAALRGVDLDLAGGEILALVGESGCGKSTLGLALMGLLDAGAQVRGSVRLDGRELIGLSEAEWRELRGARMAMVFQDPMQTLNPVLRIETQMVEALTAHRAMSRPEARRAACAALERLGVTPAAARLRAYPHELSGGQRQRVVFATALLNQPELIIADEPTTALDNTVQAELLALVRGVVQASGVALIWITHDLAVVAGMAGRIAVMYAGRVVETGTAAEVLVAPAHPYTRALLDARPERSVPGSRLPAIAGQPPSLLAPQPGGCAFHPRCPQARERCRAEAPQLSRAGGRGLRCFYPLVRGADAGGVNLRVED